MDEIIGSWEIELYIGVRRPGYIPPKKSKKIKQKKEKPIKNIAKRGIDMDYCIYCNCKYQHRIASQHKKTAKHIKNFFEFTQ